MELLTLENLRMLDRNKAGGNALLKLGSQIIKAEWVFYLQGNECLNIRLGRHDGSVSTDTLEEYLQEHRVELRQLVKLDVIRLRTEQVQKNNASESPGGIGKRLRSKSLQIGNTQHYSNEDHQILQPE